MQKNPLQDLIIFFRLQDYLCIFNNTCLYTIFYKFQYFNINKLVIYVLFTIYNYTFNLYFRKNVLEIILRKCFFF